MEDEYCVIFDLDGTLVDTAPDLHRALTFVLERENIAVPDLETVRPFVGHGARHLIAQSFKHEQIEISDAALDGLTEDFVDHYARNIAVDSMLFPGLRGCLEQLSRMGTRLGVCTNKRTHLAQLLLEQMELDSFFSVVLGGDALDVRKPHPFHLLETIRRVKSSPHQAVLIGDSTTDAEAARNANVPFIAVSFGYCDVALSALGATAIIDQFGDLIPALEQIFGGK